MRASSASERLRRIAGLAWPLALCGCQPRASNATGLPSPLEVRAAGDHPSLSLVARDGDPFAGIALAATDDAGAESSLWVAALVASRIERATGARIESRPSGNGFVLRARIGSADQAAAFVRAARDALAAPATSAELATLTERVTQGAMVRTATSASDEAIGDCVGELVAGTPPKPPGLADVERVRQAIFSARATAFAAVGARPLLEGVAVALRDTSPWPTSDTVSNPWPTSDVVGRSPPGGGAPTLSIALRVGDAARALGATASLGDPASALSLHAAALEPSWSLSRVLATTRARGACLRVDLAGTASTSSSDTVGGVAALAVDEARRALAEANNGAWNLDRAILEATDPRDAAAVAAWGALGAHLTPGTTRTFVNYAGGSPAAGGDAAFAAAFDRAERARDVASVQIRRASEPGQGETWALLASPCATLDESNRDAGLAALAVRAMARENADRDGVRVEPWVSTSGIGLLAHGPRENADEAPAAYAARLGDALGRAFAATEITDQTVAAARLRLQSELESETQLLWPVALQAVAPGHPSLLDPRGTWQSITEISTRAAELERDALVRGALRLAVISNGAPAQADHVEQAIERWLKPARTDDVACPASPPLVAEPAEYDVDSATAPSGTHALVAVAVAPTPAGIPLEAEWTAYLLNRPNGWLERSVRVPGLAVHADATLLGGKDAAALAIEIVGTEDKAREAVAQVRAVLARLSEGAATAEDLAAANASYDAALAERAVDPRERVVRLWIGAPDPVLPDLAALRRFQRATLAPERHIVVLPKER